MQGNVLGKDGTSDSVSKNALFAPYDVTNIKIATANEKLYIKWTDPEDKVITGKDGKEIATAKWKGTKVVVKPGSLPTSQYDGTVVIDNTEKNKYKDKFFEINNLNNKTEYYIRFYAYSTDKILNENETYITGTPTPIVPNSVTKISAKSGNGKATITWTDPEDSSNETEICNWKGTKLVIKQGSYPTNENDGTLIVDSQVRNQYSTTAYEISNLTNDVTYYGQLFPYSTDDVYNTDETNRFEVTPKAVTVYGVQRLISSSSTAWERIEAGIGLVANATKDGSAVQNDFDKIYPWSDIISVDLSADGTINSRYGDADFSFINPKGYIMTYFPEFWYKRVQEDSYERIYIADNEYDGFTRSESFYLGRYTATGSSSAVTCKSGLSNLVNITLPSLRNACKAIGNKWGQLDIWRWSMLQLLYLTEYADYDSQKILGLGRQNSSNSSAINTGSCDSLGMKSGCLKNDGASGVIYRGIENPFGNIYQWLDGCNISSYYLYVCKDRTQYASDKTSAPYEKLSYSDSSSSGYIKTMGYDSNHPEVQRASATGGGTNTYCPDYFYSYSNTRVVYVGGSWNYGADCGLWCANSYHSSYSYGSVGGRPLFIPA